MDETKEKSFAEQVDDVLAGKLPFYMPLVVCDTPQILLDVGCRQLPMMYTQRHLKDAIHPKSKSNPQWHGLTVDQVKMMPELLQTPVMVYDSLSRNDSIVVLTSELDRDNCPIIISIKPNGKGTYALEKADSNFVTSMYGREKFLQHITRVIKCDNLLYCSKEKSQELFERWGLQLPELTNDLDFNCIIHQSRNIIKPFEEKAKNTHNVKSKKLEEDEPEL